MKKITLVLSTLIICFCACKKNEPTPEASPNVTLQPDTLTSGWSKIKVLSGFASDIFFYNNSIGFLAKEEGIFKTIDGGLTWSFLNNRSITNIAITSNGNAFFVRDSIYKTENGGLSFTNLFSPITNDIYFINNNEGFYINSNQIFKSIDAGVTWQNIATTNFPISGGYSSLCFSSTNNGVIVNNMGIFRTNGSPSNWLPANFLNAPNYGSFQAAFYTANNDIYAINNSGKLYKSLDGGVNFSLIKDFNNGISFGDIHFIDNNVGYASNGNKIYKTIDAGLNWTVVVALGESVIIEIHFTDGTHGWACGSNGLVLKYN